MITIRPAKHSDAPAMSDVHVRSISELGLTHYSATELAAWARPIPASRWIEFFSECKFVVAVNENNVLLGFGALSTTQIQIWLLYVDPNCAMRGVGSALCHELEAIARNSGSLKLMLDSSLNAQTFYQKMGYQIVGEKSREINGQALRCIEMIKSLHK